MTDPMLPPDDEIVSAVLDGEASADERARVDADPAARARLAQFDEVHRRVAAPVTVPSDARERALAAALGAFDAAANTTGPAATVSRAPSPATTPTAPTHHTGRATGPVDELAARRGRPGRGLRVLAAAAAVVVVLIGVGAVIRSTEQAEQVATGAADSRDPELSSEAPQSADQDEVRSGPEENAPVTSTTPPPGPRPTTAPTTTSSAPAASDGGVVADAGPALELGTVATSRELRTLVLAGVDAPSDRQQPSAPTGYDARAVAGGPAFVACADVVHAADPEVGAVLLSAGATYQGEPAIVLAFAIDRAAHPAANGSVRIYALDAATCATRSVQTVR